MRDDARSCSLRSRAARATASLSARAVRPVEADSLGLWALMSWRTASWIAAVVVAAAALVYGALDEGPPKTNADRVRALAEDFACPVCAGQSVAESDVPVAREI
ncbi:MAG: hypothetical protein F4076_11150, partial [Acidimicrobiaceae bacterium]|nr:hypothetical protein [Acidimicrobiaceae bacterium]